MPNNLTDDPTQFPEPIQVPAAGDPRTDTSVAFPFQQLADRTANNKARVDAVVPFSAPGASALPAGVVSGVSTLLTAVSISTMQAIPAAERTAGMLCVVADAGIYQYTATPPSALANVVVIPNDSIGGWLLLAAGYLLLNQPNTVVQSDSSGRVPAASVRNGLVYVQGNNQASIGVNTSTTGVQQVYSGGAPFSFACLAGDIIEVDFSCYATIPANALVTVVVGVAGTGVENWAVAQNTTGNPVWFPLAGNVSFPVVSAATYSPGATLSNSAGGGSSSITLNNVQLRMRVFRP